MQRDDRVLGGIALAALILRLGIRMVVGTEGYWEDGYTFFHELARGLAAGHGYAIDGRPTAFRVPLYPMFIAAVQGTSENPWRLIGAQALVSAAGVVITGLIARRMAGPRAGTIAAILCALYPYGAWHDLSLEESGLFASLALAATWATLTAADGRGWRAAAAGLLFALAVLTRTTLLPVALFACGWLAWGAGPRRAGILAGALLLGLAPWLVWAQAVAGRPGLGTEFGAALYAANHPALFTAYPEQSVDIGRARAFAALTPAERAERDRLAGNEPHVSDWYARKGMALIAADPAGFVRHGLVKLGAAFGPWPSPRHGPVGNLGYAACWVPLLLAGAWGAWRRRRAWRDDLLLYAQFASFAAVTAVLWAHTSHRTYLDPYLMAFAATGLSGRLATWRLAPPCPAL